jgi:hypothetical protein
MTGPRRILAFVFGSGLGLLLASGVRAADETSLLWQRGALVVAGYASSSDSRVRADASGSLQGTDLHLEGDLGLDRGSSVGRFGLELFPRPRHELSLTYYRLSRAGERDTDEPIRFGDLAFPAHSRLSARLDLEQLELAYAYWAVREERFGLAALVGVVGLSTDASVAGTLRALGLIFVEEDKVGARVAVPVVGLRARTLAARRLVFDGGVRLLPRVKVGQDHGELWIANAGAEWRLLDRLGIGLGYEYSRLRVDLEEDRWRGRADLTTRGFTAFLRLGW